MKEFSTAEINHSPADIFEAAKAAPVAIMEHRKPHFVVMSWEEYKTLNRQVHTAIYLFTDQREGEPDILGPYENEDFIIKADGVEIFRVSINQPWTHELLVNLDLPMHVIEAKMRDNAVLDAFLGTECVGSSEA